MGLILVRIVTVVATLGVIAWCVRHRRAVASALVRFFTEPTSAVNPALLRLVVFGLMFKTVVNAEPEWHAAMPAGLRAPPFGWDLLGSLPFSPMAAAVAGKLLIVASFLAFVGLFTRFSAPLAVVLGIYVIGLPYMFGKVNHGGHARMLVAMALALAPCADALSVDRLIRRLRGHATPAPSAVYTVPVRGAWILIGTTYFFPGLWKLWDSGDLWIMGSQLRFELYKRWATVPDFVPLLRVDQHPLLLGLLGAGTLAFEFGFLFAMFDWRARVVAALSAASFHLGVRYMMGIPFPVYVPLLVLMDVETWARLRSLVPSTFAERVRSASERLGAWAQSRLPAPKTTLAEPASASRALPPAVLIGLVFLGQVLVGSASISSWPISVYPTFSGRKTSAPRRGTGVRLLLEARGGSVVDLQEAMSKHHFANAGRMVAKVEGATDRDDPSRGKDVVQLFRHIGVEVKPGDRIVVIRTSWDALPPGARANFKEGKPRRYRVRKDSTLVKVDADDADSKGSPRRRKRAE